MSHLVVYLRHSFQAMRSLLLEVLREHFFLGALATLCVGLVGALYGWHGKPFPHQSTTALEVSRSFLFMLYLLFFSEIVLGVWRYRQSHTTWCASDCFNAVWARFENFYFKPYVWLGMLLMVFFLHVLADCHGALKLAIPMLNAYHWDPFLDLPIQDVREDRHARS